MKKKLLVFAALLVLALAVAGIASAIEVQEGGFADWGSKDQIAKVGEHEVVPGSFEIDAWPTCVDEGRIHFVCNQGDTTHIHYVYFKAFGHAWSSKEGIPDWGVVTIPPTCTSTGLAIDYCLRCEITNPEVTRVISHKPHEYDLKHYDVVKEPGCGEDGEGLGWKTCIYCGVRHPDTKTGEHLVVLDKIAHTWSDWRVDEESDCDDYGVAARTCIACGAVQHLDEYHPVTDQGKTITIGDVLPKKNEAWTVNGQKLNGKEYIEYSALENDLTALKFEYEVKEDWLEDCYTRWITYTCPYCHGQSYNHDDFTVKVVYPATLSHVWNEERDPYLSVPAWCTTDGYDIFLCKYDGVYHGHGDTTKPVDQVTALDGFKKVVTKAVGHDWTEWKPAEVFEKDGKQYAVMFRSCNRCGAHEQKTEAMGADAKEQGLALVDGQWVYLIDGEIATGVTALVPFQGGEFWVVNGRVAVDASGLTICPDGKAYFLSAGQVQRVTQWAEYRGEWFIIADGLLNPVTGLKEYDGATFAVESGRKLHVDGLWCDPVTGTWVYCADGMVDTSFSGEVKYDGATFTVVNGYLVV
jgi:hypothetical protein